MPGTRTYPTGFRSAPAGAATRGRGAVLEVGGERLARPGEVADLLAALDDLAQHPGALLQPEGVVEGDQRVFAVARLVERHAVLKAPHRRRAGGGRGQRHPRRDD